MEKILRLIEPVGGILTDNNALPTFSKVDLLAKTCRLLGYAFVLGILSSLWIPVKAEAADPAGSRDSMQEAIAKIPLNNLNAEARQKINVVLDKPSFFRRLPAEAINCDPDLFLFLVRHPEVLVNIWDLMQITKVELQRVAPFEFRGSDGAGTTCQSELIYGTPNLHIYYGTGVYSGPLMARDISGRCLCVLSSSSAVGPGGKAKVGSQMDVYMKLDSVGADLVTRTVAPVVGKTADSNFRETASFISQLSQVCETNPTAVQDMAQQLQKITPEVRQQFMQTAWQVALKAARAKAALESDFDNASPVPGLSQAIPSSESGLKALEALPRSPEKPDLIMKR
ncbi:MAG: hypothetical protein RLY14_2861 [Planctomycetota bacterium]|jgi:hypothetical protein